MARPRKEVTAETMQPVSAVSEEKEESLGSSHGALGGDTPPPPKTKVVTITLSPGLTYPLTTPSGSWILSLAQDGRPYLKKQ